jgi:exodeoxyribonuclease VII large subunit
VEKIIPVLQNGVHEKSPILSVSELSYALKHLVEEGFSHVQVRGEISGAKYHTSGHLYFTLKDNVAVLDAVCWRGVIARQSVKPADGIEVICTGHLSIYPGRSKYQLIVERMEVAGEGALLKLLEERKRQLAAEGLFALARKKPLPFLPRCIGIITSPTGAVIQDILHRLRDRFPCKVLLWPVLVQGEGAAEQIAAAIEGFNALPEDGNIPKPDLLIVARGGGSLEDLWAFNEEVVVRAAAASAIPLISGVGHEPDITLIDLAADYRAPTPTAAAEKAVPVRQELSQILVQLATRLNRGLLRHIEDNALWFDDQIERLVRAMMLYDERCQQTLALLAQRLRHPQDTMTQNALRLQALDQRLHSVLMCLMAHMQHRFESLKSLLKSYSYEATLARGFALLKAKDGHILTSVRDCTPGLSVHIALRDGQVPAMITSVSEKSKPASSTLISQSRQPKLWDV